VLSVSQRPRPSFVPGLHLNQRFYHQVIRPILDRHLPGVPYSAGLLGEGSDVLGYDCERSMDHNWGPRGVLFFAEEDHPTLGPRVSALLAEELPTSFLGFPTNYTLPRETYLAQRMEPIDHGPVRHLVRTFTVRTFFGYYLGFEPPAKPSYADWLTFPQQALLEVTAGAVYHDGLGTLVPTRRRFAYFPDPVWIYLLYCQWLRIANELSYQARSGERGDELGSRVLASRMVDEIIRLCFLMERRYMPYSKWRGYAFQSLPVAGEQLPLLIEATSGRTWRARQAALARSYQLLLELHNRLGITEPVSTKIVDFHGRGYRVVDVGEVMEALRRVIPSRRLRRLKYQLVGSTSSSTTPGSTTRTMSIA
jgi:hypothetical protein